MYSYTTISVGETTHFQYVIEQMSALRGMRRNLTKENSYVVLECSNLQFNCVFRFFPITKRMSFLQRTHSIYKTLGYSLFVIY